MAERNRVTERQEDKLQRLVMLCELVDETLGDLVANEQPGVFQDQLGELQTLARHLGGRARRIYVSVEVFEPGDSLACPVSGGPMS